MMRAAAARAMLAATLVLLGALAATTMPLPLRAQAAPGATPQAAGAFEPIVGQQGKDVVWVPTPDAVVQAMLDMTQVSARDYVVDLGSGDGKIAIAAAQRGARALGIEYDPRMVEVSKRQAEAAGVAGNVSFVQGDIFESDFSAADVVTLYLLPNLNRRLRPILLRMKPGTRVASHQFSMGDWTPDRIADIAGRQALMWIVPANVAGQWSVRIGSGRSERRLQLRLEQRYQKLRGDARRAGGRAAPTSSPSPSSPLRDATLNGAAIRFDVAGARGALQRFAGSADHHGRMSGTVIGADGRERRFEATRTAERH